MKTATPKKKSQCQRLLAYLRKNRRGITTMEAFRELGITCVHKRISDLEASPHYHRQSATWEYLSITRTPERTASDSIVTRYKLAR